MDTEQVLRKYGVPVDLIDFQAFMKGKGNWELMIKLQAAIEKACGTTDGETEAEKAESKKRLEAAKEIYHSPERAAVVADIENQIRTLIFDAIDADGSKALSIMMVDMVRRVAGVVANERDYFLSTEATPRKVRQPSAGAADRRAEAIELKKLWEQFFPFFSGQKFPKELKVKKLKDGSTVPALAKLPPEGDGVGTGGRTSVPKNLRLAWNGEELPAEKQGAYVAHELISDRRKGYVVTWKMVQGMLEETGKSLSADFELTFPTGTLSGRVVTDEETAS